MVPGMVSLRPCLWYVSIFTFPSSHSNKFNFQMAISVSVVAASLLIKKKEKQTNMLTCVYHCNSLAASHMATIQGWRASDWSNRAEQKDEGWDGPPRYRSTARAQGDPSRFSSSFFFSSSGRSLSALLMGNVFPGCGWEDDRVGSSLCIHHQGEARKSGWHCRTLETR